MALNSLTTLKRNIIYLHRSIMPSLSKQKLNKAIFYLKYSTQFMGKLKRLLYIISLYIYLNKSLFILKFVITNRDNDLVCKVSYI